MGDGLANFSVDDLSIDNNGRMIVTNPQLAGVLEAAKRVERDKPAPAPAPTKPVVPNTNCNNCNTVAGCGPINSVKGCGTKIRK